MSLRVGLTGGLASGKSTVARRFAQAGFRVVDADRLVAELYRPGAAGARAVAELFGEGALAADGSVDHRAVAARVFQDPEARKALESAIHPRVRERFAEIAAGAEEPVVVLEATLLVEAGYGEAFDLVVTVEADPEVRLQRAVARGMEEGEARRRLEAQGAGVARRARADRTIVNDGSPEELERQVQELIAELRRRVRGPGGEGAG